MWSQLLKILEAVAAIRLPFYQAKTKLIIGNPTALDARNTNDWKGFLESRALSCVWGPHPQGPWAPFHCLTLFVALDYLDHAVAGPCEEDPWPIRAFRPPTWIDSATLLLVDLPGPKSIALGAALGVLGCDLVCTFNNWPHPVGLIRSEKNLAVMLRYASWLNRNRSAYPTPGPVAWLCDSRRLGTRTGIPGEFDNRYYIEDGIIPGPNFLRERGITRIVYVTENADEILADLAVHLHAFNKDGFETGVSVATNDGVLLDYQPIPLTDAFFKTARFIKFKRSSRFRYSGAGGFGAPVPHPSSSGSGG